MKDGYGREINYLRISLTDRCNLRCRYCMPDGITPVEHCQILTYEEILRVAECAVSLGITRFKLTGGEPLVRRDCPQLAAKLKALPGVEQVTLTTNGILLPLHLDELAKAGLDGVNVSIDALCPERYSAITGWRGETPDWEELLRRCVKQSWNTKVNVVLQQENRTEWALLARLAERLPVDVRFIELMPLGYGGKCDSVGAEKALEELKQFWPDLHPVQEHRGNGPARYFAAQGLRGRIGLIDAVSHKFCANCNRVRLTSTGWLKPCLCYEEGTDLRALLRSGCDNRMLTAAIAEAISRKPAAHCFEQRSQITEHKTMSQIGG